jgi:hypothetical protein
MIVQFQGENRKDAIINHFSLDIEEEDEFFQYLEEMGYDENSDDEILESLIVMYREKRG